MKPTRAHPFDIVIVGHGPFPDAMLRAAEMICGPLAGVSALSLDDDGSLDSFTSSLDAAIGDAPGGTLVLCDIHGGTPANAAAIVARRHDGAGFVSGANLAMVVEAATSREPLDADLLAALVEAGRSGIVSGRLR